jgi:FlaG/FlaF family flagellin (archaellin)
MVKFIFFNAQLILLACLFAFVSCDKIKDASTAEIPVASVSIEFDISVDSLTTKRATEDGLNLFDLTQSINIEDLQGLSDDAIKYSSSIESIEIGSTSITITSTDGEETVVKNFVFKAIGIPNEINVSQYDLGTTYADDNLQSFAIQLMSKLFKDNDVTINTSGETDVRSGNNLKIKITMDDITLIAQLL